MKACGLSSRRILSMFLTPESSVSICLISICGDPDWINDDSHNERSKADLTTRKSKTNGHNSTRSLYVGMRNSKTFKDDLRTGGLSSRRPLNVLFFIFLIPSGEYLKILRPLQIKSKTSFALGRRIGSHGFGRVLGREFACFRGHVLINQQPTTKENPMQPVFTYIQLQAFHEVLVTMATNLYPNSVAEITAKYDLAWNFIETLPQVSGAAVAGVNARTGTNVNNVTARQ